MPSKIATSADFKKHVVDRDYADYKRNLTDLRLAYHLALSLFHLRDWTFWEHSGASHWPYSGSQGGYQGNLESLCSDFGYIRDLANSIKHAELDAKQKPSTQMVGLANTEISAAALQPGAFQASAFQTRTYIVSETGPAQYVDFEKAADAVMQMWDQIFIDNSWG